MGRIKCSFGVGIVLFIRIATNFVDIGIPGELSIKSPNLLYIILILNILFITQWILWSQLFVAIAKYIKSKRCS